MICLHGKTLGVQTIVAPTVSCQGMHGASSLSSSPSFFTCYEYLVTTQRKITSEGKFSFTTLFFVKQIKQLMRKNSFKSFSNMLPFFWLHTILAMLRQVWNDTTGCILWYAIPIFKGLYFGARIFLHGKLYSPNHYQKLFHIFLMGLMSVNHILVINFNPLAVQYKNSLWLFYLQFTTTYVLP